VDAASLSGFRRLLERTFRHNLAAQAVEAEHAARALVDRKRDTYLTAPEVVLTFRQPVRFSVAGVREHLPLGQRIESFALDAWREGGWGEIAAGGSVGARRPLRFPEVTADRVRLRVSRSSAPPAIAELGLWREEP
jgi:alpha-L-fucosidase